LPIKAQLIGTKKATFSQLQNFFVNYKPFDLCFGWPGGVLIKNGILSRLVAHVLPSIRPVEDTTLNLFIDQNPFTAHFIHNAVRATSSLL